MDRHLQRRPWRRPARGARQRRGRAARPERHRPRERRRVRLWSARRVRRDAQLGRVAGGDHAKPARSLHLQGGRARPRPHARAARRRRVFAGAGPRSRRLSDQLDRGDHGAPARGDRARRRVRRGGRRAERPRCLPATRRRRVSALRVRGGRVLHHGVLALRRQRVRRLPGLLPLRVDGGLHQHDAELLRRRMSGRPDGGLERHRLPRGLGGRHHHRRARRRRRQHPGRAVSRHRPERDREPPPRDRRRELPARLGEVARHARRSINLRFARERRRRVAALARSAERLSKSPLPASFRRSATSPAPRRTSSPGSTRVQSGARPSRRRGRPPGRCQSRRACSR